MNQQFITIKFATSKLEMLANRLWKSGEPHDLDYVYGRIWLHSLELAHYFGSATAEEYLRGLVGHWVYFYRVLYNYRINVIIILIGRISSISQNKDPRLHSKCPSSSLMDA